ncbi:hypothetical protein GGI02_004181 [Coemansia sp. RSA 2322]|uniref:Uncharacterized protein n=1 Tax=Coemansia thaxteri TaxID=2663907 RepID=A0A9W8EIH1_9FUNG|nr:hypothetical protein H4R26_003493 [Coemansia thaxteri]KAJ2467005.1 hypothetical protein GGI02_004181 [Coemansia sp. RSA 2322]
MAVPDVAGTKTVVISLATGDHGQIIPVVLHKNSNGYDPVSLPGSGQSTDSQGFSDAVYNSADSGLDSESNPGGEESVEASESDAVVSGVESPEPVDSVSLATVTAGSGVESSGIEAASASIGSSGADAASTIAESSGSDSESDSDESKKNVAAHSASSTRKKSSASRLGLPNAAIFAIPAACLCAVSANGLLF